MNRAVVMAEDSMLIRDSSTLIIHGTSPLMILV